MNCDRAWELLVDYLGEELEPADRRAFEEHLAQCDQCRIEAESLQDALQALRQLPPLSPAGLEADGRFPGPEPRTARPLHRQLGRPLALAATLLIGIGIGWFARLPDTAPLPDSGQIRQTQPGWPRDQRISEHDLIPSPFMRNALAFSTAFSRPSRR